MTDTEIKNLYKGWAKDYCNNDFLDDEGEEDLPAGVEIFLDKITEVHEQEINIASESIGDLSTSYFKDKIPQRLLDLLKPYRRLSW